MIGKQVRLTEEQDRKIRLIARLESSSQSKVVRDAIDRLREDYTEAVHSPARDPES